MSLVNDALKKARMEAARGDATDRNSHYRLVGRGERETSGAWIFVVGALVLLAGIGGVFLFRSGKQSALKETVASRDAVEFGTASAAAPAAEPTAAHRNRTVEAESTSTLVTQDQAATGSEERGPTASDASAAQATKARPKAQVEKPTVASRPNARALEPVAPAASQTTVGADPQPEPTVASRAERATSVQPGSQAEVEERVPSAPPASLTPAPSPVPAAENPSPEPASQEFLRRADIPGVGPVELGGIAWSGDRPFALVNGRVVRPGDFVSGLIVDDIQRNTVRLRGDNGSLVFRLK